MKLPTKHELKSAEFFFEGVALETAIVGDQQYVRERNGTWRYAVSWVKVPGARDLTLSERFNPKLVVANTASGTEVEAVVVSGRDIDAHPELLGWCLDAGVSVPSGADGQLPEVMVPINAWQEHERVPGEIVAPENSDDPAVRDLAIAERQYREADRALELAAMRRAEVLRQHSGSMTRQQMREITDLSVGRIQQLIQEGSEELELDEHDAFLLAIVESRRPKNLNVFYELAKKELDAPGTYAQLKQRTKVLRGRGLIERKSSRLRLTPEGKKALDAARLALAASRRGDD